MKLNLVMHKLLIQIIELHLKKKKCLNKKKLIELLKKKMPEEIKCIKKCMQIKVQLIILMMIKLQWICL